jgi:hypothetical protein
VGDSNDTDDFLSRERALLGDDADQFTSESDKLATVEDDDDLMGGDYSQANVGGQEMDGFESSFPAIDTTNDVSHSHLHLMRLGQACSPTWSPVKAHSRSVPRQSKY